MCISNSFLPSCHTCVPFSGSPRSEDDEDNGDEDDEDNGDDTVYITLHFRLGFVLRIQIILMNPYYTQHRQYYYYTHITHESGS